LSRKELLSFLFCRLIVELGINDLLPEGVSPLKVGAAMSHQLACQPEIEERGPGVLSSTVAMDQLPAGKVPIGQRTALTQCHPYFVDHFLMERGPLGPPFIRRPPAHVKPPVGKLRHRVYIQPRTIIEKDAVVIQQLI